MVTRLPKSSDPWIAESQSAANASYFICCLLFSFGTVSSTMRQRSCVFYRSSFPPDFSSKPVWRCGLFSIIFSPASFLFRSSFLSIPLLPLPTSLSSTFFLRPPPPPPPTLSVPTLFSNLLSSFPSFYSLFFTLEYALLSSAHLSFLEFPVPQANALFNHN